MEFQNNTGNDGLKFLGRSLSEQFSGTLAKSGQLRVVERAQLGKLLKEIELNQSGLMEDAGSIKATGLSAAQYLVIGVYGGSSSELHVQLKAVETSSGTVVAAREEVASVDTIIGRMQVAADAMALLIAGGALGKISVTSEPSGAIVLIDGSRAGESPLHGYSLPAGSHKIRIEKEGRQPYETSVDINEGELKSVDAHLNDNARREAFFITLSGSYILPKESYAKNPYAVGAEFGYRWRHFLAALQFRWSPSYSHDYSFAAPYTTLTEKRTYNLFRTTAGIEWHPFDFTYFSPYLSLAGGVLIASDKPVDSPYNSNAWTNTALLVSGGGGIALFPYSKVSLLLFGNYLYTPLTIDRETIHSINFFGTVDKSVESLHYAAVELGLGLRFMF